MFSFILNFFNQTKDNKKLFSDNEIVFFNRKVISAEDFLKSLLDSCKEFCCGNDNKSIHVIELYYYIFQEILTIDMHISTAITFDNIITSKYKLSNNNDEPLNFKDDSNLCWRKHVLTYVCEQYIPINEIGDIAFRKGVNDDSYIKIGKVTKIGLFLCEIVEE